MEEHADKGSGLPAAIQNQAAGSFYGPIVQAGHIGGDIHFHQSARLPAPNQLPPCPLLVDREAAVQELRVLREEREGAPTVIVVTGPAGVGKTTLSVGWAHRVRRDFPDGQLYAELCSAQGEPVAPQAILGGFLLALGIPSDVVPGDLAGRVALYRAATTDRRMLVVLDDAVTGAQVRALLPASSASLTLVTSRYRLAGLLAHGAKCLYLDRLDAAAGIALLHEILGRDRVERERENAAILVELCMRLPLALSAAGARLATRPNWPLQQMVTALDHEQQRLAALTIEDDIAVRSALDVSYRALTPAAADLYRLLSLVPGDTFGAAAAAALAGAHPTWVRHLLEALTDANLLADTSDGRYRFQHALIRLHAHQLAHAEDPDEVRDAAVRRLLGWYLDTEAQAERHLRPYRQGLPRDGEPPPAESTDFDGPQQALEWLEAECGNLCAAIHLAHERGREVTAWQLADAMWPLFLYHGHYVERLDIEETGLRAARACGDQYAEAKMLNRLGLSHHTLGDHDQAAERFQQARALWRRLGERDREAGSLRRLGKVAAARGTPQKAITSFLEAYDIYASRGATRKSALALIDLGDLLTQTGRGHEAVERLERAHDLLKDIDDPYNNARVRIVLGRAQMDAGQHAAAETELQGALTDMTAANSSVGRGEAHESLGMLAEQTGQLDRALHHYEKAIAALGEPETATHIRIRQRLQNLNPEQQ